MQITYTLEFKINKKKDKRTADSIPLMPWVPGLVSDPWSLSRLGSPSWTVVGLRELGTVSRQCAPATLHGPGLPVPLCTSPQSPDPGWPSCSKTKPSAPKGWWSVWPGRAFARSPGLHVSCWWGSHLQPPSLGLPTWGGQHPQQSGAAITGMCPGDED